MYISIECFFVYLGSCQIEKLSKFICSAPFKKEHKRVKVTKIEDELNITNEMQSSIKVKYTFN